MKQPTIEIVLFQLAEGVSQDEFLNAAQNVESWLRQVSGFRRRELSRDAAGNWVDIVHWDSLEEAQKAAAEIMSTPEGQKFGGTIRGESIQMYHVHPVHELT